MFTGLILHSFMSFCSEETSAQYDTCRDLAGWRSQNDRSSVEQGPCTSVWQLRIWSQILPLTHLPFQVHWYLAHGNMSKVGVNVGFYELFIVKCRAFDIWNDALIFRKSIIIGWIWVNVTLLKLTYQSIYLRLYCEIDNKTFCFCSFLLIYSRTSFGWFSIVSNRHDLKALPNKVANTTGIIVGCHPNLWLL